MGQVHKLHLPGCTGPAPDSLQLHLMFCIVCCCLLVPVGYRCCCCFCCFSILFNHMLHACSHCAGVQRPFLLSPAMVMTPYSFSTFNIPSSQPLSNNGASVCVAIIAALCSLCSGALLGSSVCRQCLHVQVLDSKTAQAVGFLIASSVL